MWDECRCSTPECFSPHVQSLMCVKVQIAQMRRSQREGKVHYSKRNNHNSCWPLLHFLFQQHSKQEQAGVTSESNVMLRSKVQNLPGNSSNSVNKFGDRLLFYSWWSWNKACDPRMMELRNLNRIILLLTSRLA